MSAAKEVNELFERYGAESLVDRKDTPQLLDGEVWDVEVTSSKVPSINKVVRKLVVPPGAQPFIRSIVRHEIGHGLWSSKEGLVGGVYREVYAAVEDAIINCRWEKLQLPIEISKSMQNIFQETFDKQVQNNNRVMAILFSIAAMGHYVEGKPILDTSALSSGDKNFLTEFLGRVDKYVSVRVCPEDVKGRKKLAKHVIDYLKLIDKSRQLQRLNDGTKPQVTHKVGPDGKLLNEEEVRAAQAEARTKGALRPPQKKPSNRPSKELKQAIKQAKSILQSAELRKGEEALEARNAVERIQEATRKERTTRKLVSKSAEKVSVNSVKVTNLSAGMGNPPDIPIDDGTGRAILPAVWGRCEYAEPVLVNKDPNIRFMGRASRPTSEGLILRYPDREFTDQKMFSRKNVNKSGGGTVLIDWSGSMRLRAYEVFDLIANSPRRTKVAYYCGKQDFGRIVLVADKGRYIDEEQLHKLRAGHNNIVDGPALAWLAAQPKPRIWISDGCVFGATVVTDRDRAQKGIFRPICDKNLIDEVMNTMERYEIKRCHTIKQALRVMNREIDLKAPIFEDAAGFDRNRIVRSEAALQALASGRYGTEY